MVSSLFMPLLFADDTNFFCTNGKLDILVNEINVEVVKIFTWVRVNKLSLDIAAPLCLWSKVVITDIRKNEMMKNVLLTMTSMCAYAACVHMYVYACIHVCELM